MFSSNKRSDRLNYRDFPGDKAAWREICRTDSTVPAYFKDWYWDATCDTPDDWHVILLRDGCDVIAAFPFTYTAHRGMYSIGTPWQVAASGIWLANGELSQSQKGLRELTHIVELLVAELPEYDRFNVVFDASLWTWQPFYWEGFSCTPHYTMVVRGQAEALRSSLAKKRRNLITKTERECRIEVNSISKEAYWDFFRKTCELRDRIPTYNKEQFCKLFDALEMHGALQTRVVFDEDGAQIAENLCVIDDSRFYHQFGTFMPGKNPGAQSFAIYDAIYSALISGRQFDFEGSMIRGVCEWNSSFGPVWETHYRIERQSEKYKVRASLGALVSNSRKK